MKKILVVLTLLAMLVSCAAVAEPVDLIFACQSSGTQDYINATTFANVVEPILPEGSTITVETISTGCSGAGYLIEAGMCEMIWAQNGISATVGTNDRPPFTGAAALLAAVKDNINVQVVNKAFSDKTGYTSIEQVLDAHYPVRLYSEPAGSADEALLACILSIYGYTPDDIKTWGGSITYCGGSDCAEAMKDGMADIFLSCTSVTSATLTELSMTTDAQIFSFSDTLLAELVKRGYSMGTIKAGSFDRFTEDTPNVVLGGSLLVPETMSEDLAYAMTKQICENMDKVIEQIPSWAEFTYQNAVDTTMTVVPLHPGAVKYFQEIGVIDADGNFLSEPA